VVRRELGRFRGREIDTSGDGFFAIFDGPGRAIRCACAVRDVIQTLGLEIRAGLHTGECELIGDKIAGISVHTGARVAGFAAPGEVLVSSTVKDLVAGSGIELVDRGEHELKGVPGVWRLYGLRATIAWSYDLLSEEEQRVLRALSVFAGGCTLEAADEVAEADLDTMQSLVEKSLLRFTDERYWVLETIREFASEQLSMSSAAEEARRRHALYFTVMAETADEQWLDDGHDEWLDRLEMERQNLRAAVEWAREVERPDIALRLTVGASRFWMVRGPVPEGLRWLEDARHAATEAPLRLRAAALRRVAAFRIRLGAPREPTVPLRGACFCLGRWETSTTSRWRLKKSVSRWLNLLKWLWHASVSPRLLSCFGSTAVISRLRAS
jgi:hypothetical protein